MAGMPHQRTALRALHHGVVLIVALAMGALLHAPWASAAEWHAGHYVSSALEFAPGSPIVCRGWSGGSDASGHFYTACPGPQYPYVFEFDEQGRYLRYAQLPAAYLFDQTFRMRDVAVSPDGRTMYVNDGPIVDDLGVDPQRPGGSYAGAILKFVRQPDGSWTQDHAWRSGPYLLGGRYWAPRYLDVDASGRLYTTVNAYVYEINPVNGAVAGAFGGVTTAYPGGPWVEGLDVPVGLAVAADGNSMFIVEQRHNILQRWVRDPAVGWRRDTTWGPNRNGILGEPSRIDATHCARGDRFQSPYDIGIDVAGDIYVADTSCHRVLRYTAGGNFVEVVWSNGANEELVHGIAVNPLGSVLIPELERKLIRTDPAKRPCVDVAAPVITRTGLAASSSTRAVTISVSGTDDCSWIAAVRVSGGVLGTPTWVDGAAASVQLSGWNGDKSLVIEARDTAGHVGSTTARITLALPQPRLVARRSVTLRSRGCRAGNPLRYVARASTYRVVGRCSRIVGTVVKVKRSGRRISQVQLRLSTATAQRLYSNAVGPVDIWVVIDRRTKVRKTPRPKARAIVVGALVATRTLRTVSAIPVDAIA